MTPVLQRPLELGAAIVMHSATKFLGGHGDVIAGVVATSEAWAARIRKVRIATGALLHPLAAFLLHRGLPTLPLRVKAAQDGARMIAERLARHPRVTRVHYPGLPGSDPKGLLGRQMAGPGSVLAFEVAGGFEAARRVLESVKLMVSAVSLGLDRHPHPAPRGPDPPLRERPGEGVARASRRASCACRSASRTPRTSGPTSSRRSGPRTRRRPAGHGGGRRPRSPAGR